MWLRSGIAATVGAGFVAFAACTDYESSGSTPVDAGPDATGDADAALEAAASGAVPILDDDYREGTRLKPNLLTVGGVRELVDWWDSKLNVHCAFRLVGSDYRCVPIAAAGYTEDNYWADEGCTVHAMKSYVTACTKPVLLDLTATGTPTTSCDVKFGAPSGPATSLYLQGGTCIKSDPFDAPAFSYGTPITGIELARASVEDGATASGPVVKAQFVHGDDGSYGFFRWALRDLDTPCKLATSGGDGKVACRPLSAAFDGNYADATTCSSPTFPATAACSEPEPKVGAVPAQTAACAPEMEYRLLGATVDGSKLFNKDPATGECKASKRGRDPRLGGAVIDRSTFGAMSTQRVAAGNQLDRVYAIQPNGAKASRGWFDRKNGIPCHFVRATDGALRCLPSESPYVLPFHLNAACSDAVTTAAYVAPAGVVACSLGGPGSVPCPTGCAPPAKPPFATRDADQVTDCSGVRRTEVFSLGAALSDPYTGVSASSCSKLRPDVTAYPATPVAPTEFVAATPTFE